MIPGLPVETVGNPGLECEYITSKLMAGIMWPDLYTNLRSDLAGLEFIDASETLTITLKALQKKIVTKFGLLDDKESLDYFYGKNPEVMFLVKVVQEEVDNLIDLYGIAVAQKYDEIGSKIEASASTMNFRDLGDAVNQTSGDVDHMHQLDQTQLQLRKSVGVLREIENAYGASLGKVSTKAIVKPGLTTDYKLFLQQFSTNVGEVASNARLGFTLGRTFDALFSLMPKDDLDPYLIDVFNNFLSVVIDPKSYYSKCERDEIVSSSVGQMFNHCYPEFYFKYQDMYMDDFEKMDYQDQIEFRKSFGLDENNSQLTSLCSQYVSLGFKPEPQPGKAAQ